MRLGILASHPIQYQAPWFRGLAHLADVTVFFAHRQTAQQQADAGFGVPFEWDVDLLSGYTHHFLKNVSRSPSVNDFRGCDTPEIGDIIVREKFDAFIVNGWYLKSFLQAARACRRVGTPVFIRGDSQLGMSQSWLKRLLKEVTHRALLRQFDGFLYVGRRNADYLRHYGAAEERMFFVPHCIDNDWFAERAAAASFQQDQRRVLWGATEETLVALFVGKLAEKKRPFDLIRAVAQPGIQHEKMIVVFVGSGELEEGLRAEARKLGISACFAGFKNQSELPLFYASADVLVLPSDRNETWGLVVNEAMASGMPAIVSEAVGCGPDLIEEDVTGHTFPTADSLALAERLTKLHREKRKGHDFKPALKKKMADYSLAAAVQGTISAIRLTSVQ